MTEHELEQVLETLGAQVPPPVDAGFETRLRASLRGQAPSRRMPWRAVLVATPVAAALVAVLVVTTRPSPPTLQVLGASGAQAVLPGGDVIDLDGEARVPDDTVIVVGPSGSAHVGGTRLGPNDRAVVVDGEVRVTTDTATPQPAPTPTGEPVTPPSPSRTVPPVGPSPEPSQSGPRVTQRPVEPDRPVVAFDLQARFRGSTVGLSWPVFQRDDFGSYVVMRHAVQGDVVGEGEPIAKISDAHDHGWIDRVRHPGQFRYRVVVRDTEGHVIGRSNLVTPRPAD